MVFMHAGIRPFWPAIAFFPWLFLGFWYLMTAARQKLNHVAARVKTPPLPSRARRLHAISLCTLVLLAVTRVVLADPAGSRACEAMAPQEAGALADMLYEQRDYQRAGECYQVAGDLVHANLALLQAAGPKSEQSARDLRAQRDAARALFSGVGQAFRGRH